MSGARRTILALLAASAAGPALAGVVYAPAVNFEQDGVQRRSELVLSNSDAAQMRAATVRFIAEGASGAQHPGGEVPVLWTAAGASGARAVPPAALPAGKAGMLEIAPGSDAVVVGIRLVYEMPGVYVQHADVPAISSVNVIDGESIVHLQGLEHDSGAGVLSDLALFNLGTAEARCSLDISAPDGSQLVAGHEISIAPVSSVFVADLFGKGGLELEAPAGSWASVGCDQPFWALGIRHDTADGNVRPLLPTATLGDSDFEAAGAAQQLPGNAVEAEPIGEFGFALPGTFLTCAPNNKFWRTNLFDERTAGKSFRRITVDFDIYHHSWNPPKNTHIYLWLQNGPSWSRSLFGYLIASRRKGAMKFQVKFGNKQQVTAGRSGRPGGTYHVHYEWNGVNRKVSFQLTNADGSPVTSKALNLNKRGFNVNGMFLGLGSWPTGHGPEALQYDWTYSNLAVEYFE